MLCYLVDPIFQVINTAGKPATGGYIEVYVHGTGDKYYCASDFDGTLHPFKIPLDSLGSNIILADDANTYDIYAYNRYGSLLMSRHNVSVSNSGGGGGEASRKGTIHKIGLWAVDAADPPPKPSEYWIIDLESPNENEPSGYDRLTVEKAREIHNAGAFFGLRTEHVQNPYEDNLLLETYYDYVSMAQTFEVKLANIQDTNKLSEYTLGNFGDYVGVAFATERNISVGKLHRISVRSVQAGEPSPKPQSDWIIDLESPNANEPDGYNRLTVSKAIELHENGEVFVFASSWSNSGSDAYYESLFTSSTDFVHMTLVRSGFHQRPNEISLATVDNFGDYLGVSDAFAGSEYWNVEMVQEGSNSLNHNKIHRLRPATDSVIGETSNYGGWVLDLESPNENAPGGYDRLTPQKLKQILDNGEFLVIETYTGGTGYVPLALQALVDVQEEYPLRIRVDFVRQYVYSSLLGFEQIAIYTPSGAESYLQMYGIGPNSSWYVDKEALAIDGNGRDVTVSFTEAQTRTNITTGEKLSVLFGKIKKWFTDLKALAFKDKASLTQDVSGILPIANGGTNASTAADARTNLDVYSKAEVNTAIDTAVASAYHAAGTKTVAQLTSSLLVAANQGNVYNITDSGTTTADFVDGAGHPIKAGDNVGICDVGGGVYKYDLLSGFVDMSNYLQKNGDGKDVTVTFTEAATRANIASTESLSTLFGKIKKWFADLGTVAFKTLVTSWSGTTSNDNVPSEKLVKDSLDAKATDSAVVHLAGAETIGGIKTFRNNHSSRYVSPVFGLSVQSIMIPFTNIKPYNQWTPTEQDGNHYRVWSIDVTSVVPAAISGTFVVDFAGTWANANSNGWIRKEILFSTYNGNIVSSNGDYTIAETPASGDYVVSNLIKDGTSFYLKIATKLGAGNNYPQMLILTLRETSSALTLEEISMTGAIVEGWPSWAGDKNTPVKVTASGSPVLTDNTAATVAKTGNYSDLNGKPLVYWSSQYDASLAAVSDGHYEFSIAWPTGIDTTKNYILEAVAMIGKDASEISQLNGDDLPFQLSLLTTSLLTLGTFAGVMTSLGSTLGDYVGNTSLMARISSSMLTNSTLYCRLAFPTNTLTLADTITFTVRLRFTEAP